jgi:hypothetical protein
MDRIFTVSDFARFLGILLIAGRGVGKSRLMGRFFLPQDAYRGIPTIVIDPIGETIDNFLSKILEMPRAIQEKIWPRVIYCEMAGRGGYITPFPLWYRLGTESLYQIAQRPLELIRKADAYLAHAPVHGWNPTWLIGTHAGSVLYSLGCQITELENLLTFPEHWDSRFAQIENTEARASIEFFRREYSKWSKDRRISRSEALRIKAATFTLDPSSRAMFGAAKPHVELRNVMEKRQIVLFDFSGVTDLERRRFMLMWIVSWIMSYLKARGPGHDKMPLSLLIDEFSLLTNFQSLAENSFEQELDELINVYSRSHRLWLTIASQSIGQFSDNMQHSLFSMGTDIFGRIDSIEDAEKIAKTFSTLNPWEVKSQRPIMWKYGQVGSINTYLPISEQIRIEAEKFRNLKRFEFLIRAALEEGSVDSSLHPITIENFDRGKYVNKQLVEQAKEILRKSSGLPIEPILAEITARVPASPALPELKPHPKLPRYEPNRLTLPKEDPDDDPR